MINEENLSNISPLTKSGYIDVPRQLISRSDDFFTQYHAIVEPQWNKAVNFLNNNGYLPLLKLLDRLGEKRERVANQLEKIRKELNQYQMLRGLLVREAEHYGKEKTIEESLGIEKPISSRPDWWEWHKSFSIIRNEGKDAEYIEHHFYPIPTELFKKSYAAENFPQYPLPFFGYQTWGEAIEQALTPRDVLNEDKDRYAGLLDVIKFRMSVIEAVLWDFEILGEVENYIAKKFVEPERLPDEELIIFIKKGLDIYGEDPEWGILMTLSGEYSWPSTIEPNHVVFLYK